MGRKLIGIVTALSLGIGAQLQQPQPSQPAPGDGTQPAGNLLLQRYQQLKKPKEKLSLKLKQYLVEFYKDKHGKLKARYKPLPDKYKIGKKDIIEYRITAQNNTKDEILKNVVIKGLIPKGFIYIPKSARPANPLFSIDGGKSFKKPPIKYWVVLNGKKVQKVATPDMYTNIEWIIPEIKPQKKVEVAYRVKLNPNLKITPAGLKKGTRAQTATEIQKTGETLEKGAK
ncbi:MAG: hypothetical protein ABGW77_05085 [Campylobacterales bacterium]